MSFVNVTLAFKRKLARFAASFLKSLSNEDEDRIAATHESLDEIVSEETSSIENIVSGVSTN